MAGGLMADTCPKCSGEMHQTDKNTFTGEVWREYTCRQCGFVVDVNEGQALWQVLHDGAQKDRDEQKKP
jgi:acetone carboxylase gamma subunit